MHNSTPYGWRIGNIIAEDGGRPSHERPHLLLRERRVPKALLISPSYFSEEKANEEFVGEISDSGRFKKSSVHVMLKCKKTWGADTASKRWLFDFWDYMNSTSQTAEHPTEPK